MWSGRNSVMVRSELDNGLVKIRLRFGWTLSLAGPRLDCGRIVVGFGSKFGRDLTVSVPFRIQRLAIVLFEIGIEEVDCRSPLRRSVTHVYQDSPHLIL